MEKIAKFFIDRSFLVNLISIFICVAGLLAFFNMKRDLVPPFEFQQIQVTIAVPGASPEEIEEFIAFPVEESLKGLAGMEKMISSSQNGRLQMWLNFRASFNRMTETVEYVKSQIDSIRPRLPDSIRYVQVSRNRQDKVFMYWMALVNFDEENTVHREYIQKLKKKVLKVDGVVDVEPEIRPRDLYVELDPVKMERYEVELSNVRAILGQVFKMAPLGQLSGDEETLNFELHGIQRTPEALAKIPLDANRSGGVLRLGDVAKISYKLTALASTFHHNNNRSLSIIIRKDRESDSIYLKGVVDKKIAEFNKELPEPLSVEPVVDTPHFIEQQLKVLSSNGLFGILFVLVLLMIFLNWRSALMTLWGVPIAYLGTILLLNAMGINIDLISIIGLILVLGILVDDAIIVSERYVDNLSQGLEPKEAATAAVKDLIVPVTGTVLTTIVAFSPILILKSEMAIILKAVPIIIISALALSWLESFFILPNHLAHFAKVAKRSRVEVLFEKTQEIYKSVLRFTFKLRYLGVITLIAVFGYSLYIAKTKLKHEFNLSISSEKVVINAILKKSDSLQATYKKIKPLEDIALSFSKDRVASVDTFVGDIWKDGKRYRGNRFAQVSIFLPTGDDYPTKTKEALVAEVKSAVEKFDQSGFEEVHVGTKMHGNQEKKENMVSIRVQGDERVNFQKIENELTKSATAATGIKEYVADPDRYQTTWKFVPRLDALALYGIGLQDFHRQIKGLYIRDEVIETRIAGEKVYVYTKLLPKHGLEFKNLKKFEVVASTGRTVPLSLLGKWEEVETLAQIRHRNGERDLVLDFKFDPEKTNSTQAKEDIAQAIIPVVKKFSTADIEVVDANEEDAKNQAWALRVALLCLISVFLVLAIILGSLTQPFIVALPIPFGVIGIIWALYLHNLPMGLMALIGLVGTIGVAVNDSLIMVDRINKLSQKAGAMSQSVIAEGATSRLRAIILTTITTVGGVMPMAYAIGGESGFTQPLAFSIGWGLTFATILTLFALPMLMAIAHDFSRLKSWLSQKLFKKRRSVSESYKKESIKESFSQMSKEQISEIVESHRNENDREEKLDQEGASKRPESLL